MKKQWYVERIERLESEHSGIYKKSVEKVLGLFISQKDLPSEGYEELRKVYSAMRAEVDLIKSPIDLEKLTYALQASQSGVGGCAMTEFQCKLCGDYEMWGSTSTPKFCKDCASELATDLILSRIDIMKGSK